MKEKSVAVVLSLFILTIAVTASGATIGGIEVAGNAAISSAPTIVGRSTDPLYGVASLMELLIIGEAFVPSTDTTTFSYSSSGNGRFRTSGAGFPWFDAALDLPQGVKLVAIEVEACDTSATDAVSIFLFRFPSPTGGTNYSASASSGAAATPGCNFFGVNIEADNIFVDRFNNRYMLRIEMGPDSTTSVRAARVFYRQRVAPAPATATFTDVPTSHPFFQYIEALAASGITGGCATGQYCPDAPLTRGQMAVFLSRALGLHFPN